MPFLNGEGCCPRRRKVYRTLAGAVTPDTAREAYTAPVQEAGGRCPPWKLLGTITLPKDGSQKKKKDTGELAKVNIIGGAKYEVT